MFGGEVFFFSPSLSDTHFPPASVFFFAGMADLLGLLLRVAEKAANVARVCRQEAPLFQLLVQEKTGEEKNKKFVQDFKTLADVVIQEMIRHDVGAQVGKLQRAPAEVMWCHVFCFFLISGLYFAVS